MDIRSVLKKSATAVGLAAYTFVVAELCVRAMNPQALMPRYITGTPWGVRGNIPGAAYRHRTPEVNVQYRINAQGIRADDDVSFDKPSGTCRVAMFGDSFFMGYELNLPDTIARQLESQLRQNGYRVDVLNFAVSGFGTGEMLRTYEAYASRFDPDVVIFQWHATDLEDNVRSGLYSLENEKITPAARTYLPSVAIQDMLMRSQLYRLIADNSHFYSWVRERAALLVKRLLLQLNEIRVSGAAHASVVGETKTSEPIVAPPQYPNMLAAYLLKYAKDEITGARRSFVVVDIPEPTSRTQFKSVWNLLPPQIVSGIDVVNAAETFKPLASANTKLYYERGHGHITPLAAHALAREVALRVEHLSAFKQCVSPSSKPVDGQLSSPLSR